MRMVQVFGILGILLLGGCQALLEEGMNALIPKPRSALSPQFSAARHSRIAVIVQDNAGGRSRGRARLAEDEFVRTLITRGYTVAARSDVERVVDEIRFQAAGYTSEDITRVGNLLNVNALLVVTIDETSVRRDDVQTKNGTVTNYYAQATVGGRLISVREAEVLWISNYSGSTYIGDRSVNGADAGIAFVSRVVASAFPPRYPPQQSPRR